MLAAVWKRISFDRRPQRAEAAYGGKRRLCLITVVQASPATDFWLVQACAVLLLQETMQGVKIMLRCTGTGTQREAI